MKRKSKIVSTSFEGASSRYRLALNMESVEDAVIHKLRELRKTEKIKGFRPGRAPYQVIHRIYGKRITESIVERFAVNLARKTIQEQKLQPVSRPQIESIRKTESGEYEFDLILEEFPRVEIKPVKGLKVRQLTSAPDSARLEAVQHLLNSNPEAGVSNLNPNNASMIHTHVAEQLQQISRLHLKRQVLDWLAENYEFEVPKSMATREFDRIVENHRAQFNKQPDSGLLDEYRDIAKRRIKLAIVLFELGRAQNIQIPKNEIEKLVRAQAKRDPDHQNEILSFYLENPTALAELQSPLFEDYVIDSILDDAEVVTIEVSADQLVEEAGLEIEILGKL